MEVKCEKAALDAAIAKAKKAVSSRPSMPILSCLRIDALVDQISVIGSDLETTIRTIAASDIISQGSCCVSAKLIDEAVKTLPDGMVSMRLDGPLLRIQCKRSKFNIPAINGEDFPSIKLPASDGESMVLDQAAMKQAFRRAVYSSAGDNEVRAAFQGVQMRCEGGSIVLTSTDGRKFSIINVPVGLPVPSRMAIIPSHSLEHLIPLLNNGEFSLFIDDSLAKFSIDDDRFVFRLINSKFPAIKVPDSFKTQLIMDRNMFLDALRRVQVITLEKDPTKVENYRRRIMTLEIGQEEIRILARTAEMGEFEEVLPITNKGADLNISFDASLLRDCVLLQDETFYMNANENSTLAMFHGDNKEAYVAALMPVRNEK